MRCDLTTFKPESFMGETQVHSYQVFNESNWQYNVNKVFFIVMLSLLLTFIILYSVDFNTSTHLMFFLIIASVFDTMLIIALIEVSCAVIVKIGLFPGELLESRFKNVGTVILKTFIESYSRMLYFKPVYRTVKLHSNNYFISMSENHLSLAAANINFDWRPPHLK